MTSETKKNKNTEVLVKRKMKDFTTGAVYFEEKIINIKDTREGEIIRCSSCGEVVTNHNFDHYEHSSRAGKACEFKTKST